jgi:hypothetical protein
MSMNRITPSFLVGGTPAVPPTRVLKLETIFRHVGLDSFCPTRGMAVRPAIGSTEPTDSGWRFPGQTAGFGRPRTGIVGVHTKYDLSTKCSTRPNVPGRGSREYRLRGLNDDVGHTSNNAYQTVLRAPDRRLGVHWLFASLRYRGARWSVLYSVDESVAPGTRVNLAAWCGARSVGAAELEPVEVVQISVH